MMKSNKIANSVQCWETMLGEAVGEDAAIRVLCGAAKRPLAWFASRLHTNPPAAKTDDSGCAINE